MLIYNLQPIFKARGIENPHRFLVKNGFSSHTAQNISGHQSRIFRLDHIELLCRILICEPSDLLQWTPNKNETLPDTHPLQKLKPQPSQSSLYEQLNTMSYKQIKEISNQITEIPKT